MNNISFILTFCLINLWT